MSVHLKNVNPLGAVDLPAILRTGDSDLFELVEPDDDHIHPLPEFRGPHRVRIPVEGRGCLEAGEVFEVTDEAARRVGFEDAEELAANLLEQVGNYERVTAPKKAKATAAADTSTEA